LLEAANRNTRRAPCEGPQSITNQSRVIRSAGLGRQRLGESELIEHELSLSRPIADGSEYRDQHGPAGPPSSGTNARASAPVVERHAPAA
jgi:hypothetical protein